MSCGSGGTSNGSGPTGACMHNSPGLGSAPVFTDLSLVVPAECGVWFQSMSDGTLFAAPFIGLWVDGGSNILDLGHVSAAMLHPSMEGGLHARQLRLRLRCLLPSMAFTAFCCFLILGAELSCQTRISAATCSGPFCWATVSGIST